jgi:hypothetical protein
MTTVISGSRAYCPRCRRYLRKVGTQTRGFDDPEAAGADLHRVVSRIVTGRLQEAADLHADAGNRKNKGFLQTTLRVDACPSCGRHHARLAATLASENGRTALEDFTFTGASNEPIVVKP